MRNGLIAVMCGVLLAVSATISHAITILRDPDIERGLNELARPVLAAAGLNPGSVRILVIDDPRLNAFVIDHNHIFLHSGLIMRMERAAQLQAIIAHEAAHITNGHIGQRLTALQRAKTAQAFGVLVALAAAAGGSGEAAGGIAAGAAGSAQGVFRGHSRAAESSADQSAFRYLQRAGIDITAMVEVFDLFRGQEALSAGRQDPWFRTHPLTRDRLRAAQAAAAGATRAEESNTARFWFARIHGKLTAFKRSPAWTLRRATGDSDIALMRQAIAHHRGGNGQNAASAINRLVSKRPNDPYFRELQGQILLESRNVSGAIAAYRAAHQLAPRDALIAGSLGRALLAANTASSNREALRILEQARARDNRDGRILRDLGTAYARAGEQGKAILSAAEAAALRGDMRTASSQAQRAMGLLPRGSVAWQRAQDLAPR